MAKKFGLKYNTNTDLDGEISRFLSNGKNFIDKKGHKYKINKQERIILQKILEKNKGKEKEIAKKTSRGNLERLKNNIIVSNATRFVRQKINKILSLKKKDRKITYKENIKYNIEKFTTNEIKNLAAMVKAEAGGEGKKGKVAVAYVILNRMKFGHKTLRQVLFKRTKSGKSEFSPIDDGRFNQKRNSLKKNDIKLIKDILSGKIKNPIGNATFFERSDLVNSWHKRATDSGKLKIIKTIGNHTFYAENKSHHTYTNHYSKKNTTYYENYPTKGQTNNNRPDPLKVLDDMIQYDQ